MISSNCILAAYPCRVGQQLRRLMVTVRRLSQRFSAIVCVQLWVRVFYSCFLLVASYSPFDLICFSAVVSTSPKRRLKAASVTLIFRNGDDVSGLTDLKPFKSRPMGLELF